MGVLASDLLLSHFVVPEQHSSQLPNVKYELECLSDQETRNIQGMDHREETGNTVGKFPSYTEISLHIQP
jgi:hypothetical protein